MSPPGGGRRWLVDALATGDLQRIRPSMAAAGERVNDARRHVASARALSDADLTLALAACHDAIRKAITGHMTAAGYRPRAGEGAHRLVLAYASNALVGVVAGRRPAGCGPDPPRPGHRRVRRVRGPAVQR